jgi:hypothetical protein
LSSRNLVKTHAYQVVRVNLRDSVGLFNQLEPTLAMQLALLTIMLVLRQVKLMPGKHIHCFNSLLFVLKQMAFLLSIINTF